MIQIDSKAEGPVLQYKRQDRLWREGEDIIFYFHDKGGLIVAGTGHTDGVL